MTRAAPSARASCTARCPTPPAAACTRTTSPGATPTAVSACNAVKPARGRPPACTKSSAAGLAATAVSVTPTSSAYVPCCTESFRAYAMTSSPTANLVTAGPTASTTPATSQPGISGV